MKKFLLVALFATIFCACSDRDEQPVFVTEIVMPPQDWLFAPGDGVTVSAQGFEANDEIMLTIGWEAGSESFAPNGSAKGQRAIITMRTATSITFLAPGHYPASRVEVLLLRGGRTMPLGNIRVSDGELAAALYGISKSDTDQTCIDRIDPAMGALTRIQTLGVGQGLSCAANPFGSGWIYGIHDGSITGVDLTMHYYRDWQVDHTVTTIMNSFSPAYFVFNDDKLWLQSFLVTRNLPIQTPAWALPTGISTEMLARYPAASVASYFLLTTRIREGMWRPLVLVSYPTSSYAGAEVEADAMIPFWSVAAAADEPEKFLQMGGYAVSEAGKTRLRLFEPPGQFGETLAEVPGTVLSVTEYVQDLDTFEIYLLCEEAGVRRIHVYDALNKTLRTLSGEFDCSQIVIAK